MGITRAGVKENGMEGFWKRFKMYVEVEGLR